MRRDAIETLLPAVYQRTLSDSAPLRALLAVMEAQHAPAEEVLASLPVLINPYTAPARFLPMLAHWLNLDCLFPPRSPSDTSPPWRCARLPIAEGRLRALIAAAATLSRWRGTSNGLQLFLALATGEPDFRIDDDVLDERGEPLAFHLRITVPQAAQSEWEMIERIVAFEKPAYVTCDIHMASTPTPAP